MFFHIPFRTRRECRSGAGFEATKNKCDAPGFPLRDVPSIEIHRKSKKLMLERNHGRVNQTSIDALRSWRGNCDVQFLLCESDPDMIDVKEISRVTDYVIGHTGKGNSTLQEEKETTKHIVMQAEETTGDNHDLKAVAKKIMNKAASRRLTSKQEACVLLGNLNLTSCSECIDTISISNSKRVSATFKKTDTSYMAQYGNRTSHKQCSLCECHKHWRELKKRPPATPHFTGLSSTPIFPVTEACAKFALVVHEPWTKCPNPDSWTCEFNRFINNPTCPKVARINYDRVVQRHYNGTKYVDPIASKSAHDSIFEDPEDEAAVLLAGLNGHDVKSLCPDVDSSMFIDLERGKDHTWDLPPKVSQWVNIPDTGIFRLCPIL